MRLTFVNERKTSILFYLWNNRRRCIIRRPPKNVYFYVNRFLYVLRKKSGNKLCLEPPDTFVLFRIFFSPVNNKRFFSRWAPPYRERSELREDWAYDCGCNSRSPLRDVVGSWRKITHPRLVQYITWTRTTQCPTVQLIRLPACKKTTHAVSRWYRTVYIAWLVSSYDTHNFF